RRQDGNAGHAGVPICNPAVHGDLRAEGIWDRQHHQSWAARIFAGALRIRVHSGEQWLRIRGVKWKHPLVQHHARHQHPDRPLLHDDSHAGDRRKSGAQENSAAIAGNLSRYNAAVYCIAGIRDCDCRRADIFPGAKPWSNSRAPADARRQDLLTLMSKQNKSKRAVWDARIVRRAIWDSVLKLNPRTMMRNPVMFVVEVGSVVTTLLLFRAPRGSFGFNLQITLWLWFTVLFANFAEAMAEGRGKAQADTLRKAKGETSALRYRADGTMKTVPSAKLRSGDVVMVAASELVPGDGEVIEGVASVDESAITGESAPVIREAGGDRSAVTGGTRVLSDVIKVRITSNPGETFLDR